MSDAAQDTPREHIREFETPPPTTPASSAGAATPSRLPTWAGDGVEMAPALLAVVVIALVLRRRTWRRLVTRFLFSAAIACVVAGGAFYATYLAGCQLMQCVDAAGIVPILAGLGVGFVAGVAALGISWRRVGR